MTQVVSEHSHISSNGNASTIDLVAMTSSSLLSSCETTPSLSNSDTNIHLGLLTRVRWKHGTQSSEQNGRTVWLYKHADWQKAKRLIEETEWVSLMSEDVNEAWANWQQCFMHIMHECIPQRLLPNRRNLPWLSKSLIQQMRKRNMLFSQARRTGRNSDFDRYKLMWNRVISYLRRAKSNFFRNINPGNAKKCWSSIKHLNKGNNSIPVLSHGNVSARSSQEKAEMLNTYFSTCFNQAVPPLLPDQSSPSGLNAAACDDLLCTPDEVYFYRSSLDPSKATGPDGISARMLRQTALQPL